MQNKVAEILLNIKAVHLSPDRPFTWTSGIKSPIYCDNRKIISHPSFRNQITNYFVSLIKEKYPDVALIAGTATAGIPWASFIASKLELPMIYIRSGSKGHGLKNSLEGSFHQNQKTLIIEDLISTGKSSIAAANEAKMNGLNVQAVLSIFNYGLSLAENEFISHNIKYNSLCGLDDLLKTAVEKNDINTNQLEMIKKWQKRRHNQ